MKKQRSAQTKARNVAVNRIPVFDSTGKRIESVELNKDLFNGKYNEALLHQSIVMYRANLRRGTASTKTRGQVRGGGKKPWRQKGTGRARFGSIRNPIWRGGGVAFGPKRRDFRYSLSKKMKKRAFISSINAKLKDEKVLAIESIAINEPKTKKILKILKPLKLQDKILLLVDTLDKNIVLACRNVQHLMLRKINEATSLDVLSSDHVIVTKSALKYLNKKVDQE